jgi:hypothetical protein
MKEAIRYYKKCLSGRRGASLLLVLFGTAFLTVSLHLFLQRRASGGMIALFYLLIFLALPLAEEALHIKLPLLGYALIFFLTFGSILGGNFNFYLRIPHWDTILHALSGLLFSSIGYALCKLLFPIQQNRSIFPSVLFGFVFSLAIALVWELFEAGITALFAADMQEDSLLLSFKSFYLSGAHDVPVYISDIRKTVIHYGDGQVLTLAGYLDLGLSDTLGDMAICLAGSLLLPLLYLPDRLLGGRIFSHLLPSVTKNE